MTDFIPIITEAVKSETFKTLLLGSVVGVTSVSNFLTWRLTRKIKEAVKMPELNIPEPDNAVEVIPAEIEVEITSKPSCLRTWSMDGATLTGKIRSENQDAFSIWQESPEYAFAVLCDGMGGHSGGREASETAVEVIQSVRLKPMNEVGFNGCGVTDIRRLARQRYAAPFRILPLLFETA